MQIKDLLKTSRLKAGLTMNELADKVGVSEGTISRWESGDISNMKRNYIIALAKALNLPPLIILKDECSLSDINLEETSDDCSPSGYYANPEVAEIAQQIFDDPDLHALFDAAQDVKPENLKLAAEMLRRFKETNPNG